MPTIPTEPAAELRQAASGLWQLYVALTNQGFTERQALVVIGHVLANQQQNPGGA